MTNFLSVIIIAKNEEKYIDKCLNSLIFAINTWGGDSEIILVDNGSNDLTKEIALGYGCKIIEDRHSGLGRLRNLGAKSSEGQILGFLDADCIVDPNWISYCLSDLNDINISMVGTRAVPNLDEATWVEDAWFALFTGVKKPKYVKWLGSSNFFVKKEEFLSIGGFNEELITAEDVDLCNRLIQNNNIMLEDRINTIHLRESKTLKELFKREFWRGKGSFGSYIRSFKSSEFLSVFIPLLNFLLIVFFLFFVFINKRISLVFLLAFLSLPALLMYKKGAKISSLNTVIHCYIIATVYLLARSCSIINEIYSIIKIK